MTLALPHLLAPVPSLAFVGERRMVGYKCGEFKCIEITECLDNIGMAAIL